MCRSQLQQIREFRLKGKTALVLGASTGLGHAVAKEPVDEGARVSICARTALVLERTAKVIGATAFTCNLNETGTATKHLKDAATAICAIDIVAINTVGVAHLVLQCRPVIHAPKESGTDPFHHVDQGETSDPLVRAAKLDLDQIARLITALRVGRPEEFAVWPYFDGEAIMDSLDLRVLADALAWKCAGHAVSLVTVVETWGSAPRPPGALLAVRDDGWVSGSVSGGCVEDDLIARAKAALRAGVAADAQPSMIVYGVTKEDAARFGLPCGGTLRLVQELVRDLGWIEEVLARTADHRLVARTLRLATGDVLLSEAVRGQSMAFDGTTLTTVFGPKWRLLLIGAGQLSQAVAQIAGLLDFEVLVSDPREEYAATLEVPGVQRMQGMPDDVVREIEPDPHTAIVALTHDPRLDDMALLEALKSDAFYVGALGSRRNQDARKKRLAEHFGFTVEELARLHGPVGLRLGAKTPAEIAVSILAEIVQVKNAQTADAAGGMTEASVVSGCTIG